MIKKYAILTLILSLITTTTFPIIPESVSKAFAFFQDTRKSISQIILEFVREKVQNTGCYLYEGEKVNTESNVNGELLNREFPKDRNQEDYFVEYNLRLFDDRARKDLNKMPVEEKRSACLDSLKDYQGDEKIRVDEYCKSSEDFARQELKLIYNQIDSYVKEQNTLFCELRKKNIPEGEFNFALATIEHRVFPGGIDKILYSKKPDIIEILKQIMKSISDPVVTKGWNDKFKNIYLSYVKSKLIKYCQECQKKNNWD